MSPHPLQQCTLTSAACIIILKRLELVRNYSEARLPKHCVNVIRRRSHEKLSVAADNLGLIRTAHQRLLSLAASVCVAKQDILNNNSDKLETVAMKGQLRILADIKCSKILGLHSF